jgi:hypothetical protein
MKQITNSFVTSVDFYPIGRRYILEENTLLSLPISVNYAKIKITVVPIL